MKQLSNRVFCGNRRAERHRPSDSSVRGLIPERRDSARQDFRSALFFNLKILHGVARWASKRLFRGSVSQGLRRLRPWLCESGTTSTTATSRNSCLTVVKAPLQCGLRNRISISEDETHLKLHLCRKVIDNSREQRCRVSRRNSVRITCFRKDRNDDCFRSANGPLDQVHSI